MTQLTVEKLREDLDYCQLTGNFYWRTRRNGVTFGAIAGCKNQSGYIQIKIRRELHLAHRLAWLHVYGVWPTAQIDHIDRDPSNNRLVNLREASPSQNKANTACMSNSTIGLKGVERSGKRYMARIKKNGVRHYLGQFDTPEDAHEAYVAASRKLYGEFALTP